MYFYYNEKKYLVILQKCQCNSQTSDGLFTHSQKIVFECQFFSISTTTYINIFFKTQKNKYKDKTNYWAVETLTNHEEFPQTGPFRRDFSATHFQIYESLWRHDLLRSFLNPSSVSKHKLPSDYNYILWQKLEPTLVPFCKTWQWSSLRSNSI